MFSIKYFIFLISKLFDTSDIKLVKLRTKLNFTSSSDLPDKKS